MNSKFLLLLVVAAVAAAPGVREEDPEAPAICQGWVSPRPEPETKYSCLWDVGRFSLEASLRSLEVASNSIQDILAYNMTLVQDFQVLTATMMETFNPVFTYLWSEYTGIAERDESPVKLAEAIQAVMDQVNFLAVTWTSDVSRLVADEELDVVLAISGHLNTYLSKYQSDQTVLQFVLDAYLTPARA